MGTFPWEPGSKGRDNHVERDVKEAHPIPLRRDGGRRVAEPHDAMRGEEGRGQGWKDVQCFDGGKEGRRG
eukprot:scaffold824_cov327-Pavlova_lutheri.AAC.49